MINVKDEVYKVLSAICDNVSDEYPSNWASLPAIQLTEEDNKVSVWTDNKEQISYVRYRIDIWHSQSTSKMAIEVDNAIASLGLERIGCQDVADPSHLKHKVMRYEALLENVNGQTYVYHEQ